MVHLHEGCYLAPMKSYLVRQAMITMREGKCHDSQRMSCLKNIAFVSERKTFLFKECMLSHFSLQVLGVLETYLSEVLMELAICSLQLLHHILAHLGYLGPLEVAGTNQHVQVQTQVQVVLLCKKRRKKFSHN